MQKNATNFTSK